MMQKQALSALTLVLASASALGCSPDFVQQGEVPPATLALTASRWNPAGTDVGSVAAVVEQGTTVTIFGSRGVMTLREGAAPAIDGRFTEWRAGAAIPSADRASTWLVGIDGAGHVQRVDPERGAVDVSVPYGVGAGGVEDALGSNGVVVFRLEDGVAISKGADVTRYRDTSSSAVAIAPDGSAVALADRAGIRVFSQQRETSVALPDAAFVAYDAGGHLFAATPHEVYAIEAGTASRVYDAAARTVGQLAGAGPYVWIGVDSEVVRLAGRTLVSGSGPRLTPQARLVGSPSGDVWLIAGGHLERWTSTPKPGADEPASGGDEALWTATVKPIFESVCSRCHSPAGSGHSSSGIDLSTYDAWVARRSAVRARVVTGAGTSAAMPPDAPLSEANLDAIAAWARP